MSMIADLPHPAIIESGGRVSEMIFQLLEAPLETCFCGASFISTTDYNISNLNVSKLKGMVVSGYLHQILFFFIFVMKYKRAPAVFGP